MSKNKKKRSNSRPKQRSTSYSRKNSILPESIKVNDVEIKKSDSLSLGNELYVNNRLCSNRILYHPKPVYKILIKGREVIEFCYWDIINSAMNIGDNPFIPNVSMFSLDGARAFMAAQNDINSAMGILFPCIISDFAKTKAFRKLSRKTPLRKYVEEGGLNNA